ncbi:bifunctional DNA primase/polymerase [Saccharothrix variisporea]|uniref:Bifunctional DNA primase/polymerase-like protein n=1 Tax=Saccharothrix variisporea TaxID=543527 RepID=A0A495XCV3_9PSEU|nr:bifunctional DNA primase/polymerase [Saccharothrix variisporea]RKT69368.1 bifunctional DNA primase/polymerase-like protein [Saccharothrix variisporea]
MTEHPLVEAALAAIRRGWPVFPARPGDKRPAVPEWERWACTDPDRITGWWTEHPYANPAIATGPAGLVVLDLDDGTGHGHRVAGHGKHTLARAAAAAGERVPWATYTVRTPNNGLHLYFSEPTGTRLHNTHGRLGELVDTRAHHGYVLAAGARIGASRYAAVVDAPIAPLPRWLADALTPPEPTDTLVALRDGDVDVYARAALSDEAHRVRTALPGTRRYSLLRAAARMGRLPGLDKALIAKTLCAASDRHVAEGAYSETERERAISDGIAWGRRHPRHITPDGT